MSTIEFPELLLTGEVSDMFRVDPKTVTRWAKEGKVTAIRTLGGHRRYVRFEVEALMTGRPLTREQTATLRHFGGA